MSRRMLVLDVFTDQPLEGNPVAILLDSLDLDERTMQRFARETNLSETVFVGDPAEDPLPIRIFTPETELPFAGHPVLGTAFAIAGLRGGESQTVNLLTRAGQVPVRMTCQHDRLVRGEMEQPLPLPEDVPWAEDALRALGIREPALAPAALRNGPLHVYTEVSGIGELSALRPDMRELAALGPVNFTVYVPGERHEDHRAVRSRMFAPGIGVPEDPATGSAAGPLAFHLLRHGRLAPGEWIRIDQGMELGRPSVLWACAEGTPEGATRVLVAGAAVTVATGEWAL